VCVCVCVFGMMKAGAVLRPFCWVWLLLCLEAEGDVTGLVSLHPSAAFWNLQPSCRYRFCTSFLFAPAETESWSRDGDSEQQGVTRLFPSRRLKRKFAVGWEIQTSDHTENIKQGNTAVMFLAACDVSWDCVILSPVWASFPQSSSVIMTDIFCLCCRCAVDAHHLLFDSNLLSRLQVEIKIKFLPSWTGQLVQTGLCWLVLVWSVHNLWILAG